MPSVLPKRFLDRKQRILLQHKAGRAGVLTDLLRPAGAHQRAGYVVQAQDPGQGPSDEVLDCVVHSGRATPTRQADA